MTPVNVFEAKLSNNSTCFIISMTLNIKTAWKLAISIMYVDLLSYKLRRESESGSEFPSAQLKVTEKQNNDVKGSVIFPWNAILSLNWKTN